MQYVIITFRQVIFMDASTSGFKSKLIIRSLLHTFVAIVNAFLKNFDANSLDKMYNSVLVLIHAKWERKITHVWLFCFAPSKIYLNNFCKMCQQKAFHPIKFILWFFGLKTCKDDCYLQKINLFIKKIPSNQVLLPLKNQVIVEWFLLSVPYFCDKSGRYLDLNQS